MIAFQVCEGSSRARLSGSLSQRSDAAEVLQQTEHRPSSPEGWVLVQGIGVRFGCFG